ncbi:hypothetical protein BT96DRAFT_1032378 [Gymnopus androsaceus JB14]|uniref:Uncharacterized protein n=1 Tax=Gymnopus androsaceus JB14 TaxID=1447944 RepID=A0A6A4HKV4_9AGAR|nr:hypothetical protein BT96DRAFT_1032378 [Gymnopus androsaceus JB14]
MSTSHLCGQSETGCHTLLLKLWSFLDSRDPHLIHHCSPASVWPGTTACETSSTGLLSKTLVSSWLQFIPKSFLSITPGLNAMWYIGWKKRGNRFYFSRLFDPYIKKEFEVLRVGDVRNVPEIVRKTLQERYEYSSRERSCPRSYRYYSYLCYSHLQ